MDMEPDWLRKELKKPGRSQSALARFLGLDASSVNRMTHGTRQIKASEADKIRLYLVSTGGGELSHIPAGEIARHIPVLGTVEAGAWREVANDEVIEPFSIPVVEHRIFDGETFALKVSGPSMNLHYPDGSFVLVRPWAGGPLPFGKRIVVRRIRPDGLYETTIKELTRNSRGESELWPRSADPRHQTAVPFDGDGVTVEIVGRVIANLSFEE
jgi:SOS-response transcriptional repressor LexA